MNAQQAGCSRRLGPVRFRGETGTAAAIAMQRIVVGTSRRVSERSTNAILMETDADSSCSVVVDVLDLEVAVGEPEQNLMERSDRSADADAFSRCVRDQRLFEEQRSFGQLESPTRGHDAREEDLAVTGDLRKRTPAAARRSAVSRNSS